MFSKSGILCGCIAAMLVAACQAEDWPRFRGPEGTGISEGSDAPADWSNDQNLRWTSALPGPGSSSPIVVGDRIYLTCYTGYGINRDEPGDVSALMRHLLCIDRNSGEILWQADVPSKVDEDDYQGFITEHGYASSTPVTDGEHIFVHFGKTGVVAFDRDGNQKWMTSVGTDSDPARWGNGASAILHDDLLIVNAANMGHKIVALDTNDGSEVWSYDDESMTSCWSTPIIVSVDGREELITCVPGKILALDPHNGEELWFADSPIQRTTCASVVANGDKVFAMGGRAGSAIGVRCGGDGDVSATHTLWQSKLRSGIGTPVVVNNHLFWTATGIAFCASCENGESIFKERLPKPDQAGGRRRPSGDYASAIAIDDRVLLMTRSGEAHWVAANAAQYQHLGSNQIAGDPGPFNATPAVSDGEIYFRSDKALYCVAKKDG